MNKRICVSVVWVIGHGAFSTPLSPTNVLCSTSVHKFSHLDYDTFLLAFVCSWSQSDL